MRVSYFFLLLFFLASIETFAHREEVYFLWGTIGNTEVGLELDEYGENCMVRYFTFDDRYDRMMEGVINEDNTFELHAVERNGDKHDFEASSLKLFEYETDKWNGIFTDINGSALEVNLKRILIDSLNHPFTEAIKKYNVSPYAALKTRDIQFVGGKEQKIGKSAFIREYTDPASQVKWFRVVAKAKTFQQVDSVNVYLTAEHLVYISARYNHENSAEIITAQTAYKVQFLNERFLSYTVSYTNWKQNSTTAEKDTHFTLFISDAKKAMLEDLFWFSEESQPKLIKGEYKWTLYRYHEFGPKVYAILQQLYPHKFSASKNNPCRYDEMRIWYFPDWYLTKKGLVLISKSPLSTPQCKEIPQGTIPYKRLKNYVSKGISPAHKVD